MTSPWKSDFPLFHVQKNQDLVYLDSAATTQKPQCVLDAVSQYYQQDCANIHRGVYELSERSSTVWEESRATIAAFFGAKSDELILTSNTTQAINGVAYGWGMSNLAPNDVVLTTIMEHHSNLVPWQQVTKNTGSQLEVLGVSPDGQLELEKMLATLKKYGNAIKVVALTYVSNTTGVVNPIAEIISSVRRYCPLAVVLLDAAQAAAHLPINFHNLDVDFLAFSGHKLYAPMGSGGLLVKSSLLDSANPKQLQPWLFGGGMIGQVSPQSATWNEDPSDRFTAGTPDVAAAVGLAEAVTYLSTTGWQAIIQHEQEVLEYALQSLLQSDDLHVVGPHVSYTGDNRVRLGSVTWLYKGVHAHDVAQVLSSRGVAVRSGHHCTMPLHTAMGWPATVRASFGIYTSKEDIYALLDALQLVKTVFRK